ncbi:MAG: hypothetical protein ABSD81_03555 [Methanomicrobiales archaeon]
MDRNLVEFLEIYKNIAEIFSEEWFESELKKPKDEMHVLAKQFTFGNTSYNNSISNHRFDHLEEYLKNLKNEIQRKGKIKRKLRDSNEFPNFIGQIEISSFIKNLGFTVELDPLIPNSRNISDIKISKGQNSVYIEVRTLNERAGEIIYQKGRIIIRTINKHPTINIQNKIEDKTKQLSHLYPGIVAVYLDPSIALTRHIETAFFEIAEVNPIITGLLLYHHYQNNEGCHISVRLFMNPNADKPLPESIKKDLRNGGIQIYYLTDDHRWIMEEATKGDKKDT